ncbi:MAG TPA: ATP-dependent helicase, partial [Streptomyces sp.]|nr:ATP-dependent helicase [Streptomyces sp.]
RLMACAGIVPQITRVRSGEAELSRITGAQAPSGIPVTIAAPAPEPARRGGTPPRRRRSRRGRTGQGQPVGEAPRRTAQRQRAFGSAA